MEIEKLIKDLNTDIICGTAVAAFIKNIDGYVSSDSLDTWDNMVNIGTLDDNMVYLDPRLIWSDLTICDLDHNELLDLENLNVTPIDLL